MLPRLPEVEGASHCTDGKTEAWRKHIMPEITRSSRGCSCLSSRRGELGWEGGEGTSLLGPTGAWPG